MAPGHRNSWPVLTAAPPKRLRPLIEPRALKASQSPARGSQRRPLRCVWIGFLSGPATLSPGVGQVQEEEGQVAREDGNAPLGLLGNVVLRLECDGGTV